VRSEATAETCQCQRPSSPRMTSATLSLLEFNTYV